MTRKKKKKDEVAAAQDDQTPVEAAEDQVAVEPVEAEPLTPEQERDDLLSRLQRLAADYQNYQKRVQKDVAHAREFANESLMKSLLAVLDNMEHALASAKENHGDDDPFLTGMQLVHENMLDVLGQNGLAPIEADGKEFDPEKHQALMQQESDEVAPMTVLQELQRGYELKGRTLRPASVIVAKAPEADADDEAASAE